MAKTMYRDSVSTNSLISIIIPVYNAARYIGRCIDSILIQTYRPIEIIVIDDGSTDGSKEICKKISDSSNIIKLFHQNHSGPSLARNVGINNAEGEYLMFVDADDILYDEHAIKSLINGYKTSNIDLSIGGYIIANDNEEITYHVDLDIQETLSRKEGIEQLYQPRYYKYQRYVWGKLYKASIIENNILRFNPEIYFNEDGLFLCEYILASKNNIFFTTYPVYKYYEHNNSAMITLRREYNPNYVTDFYALFKMYKLIKAEFHNNKLNQMAEQALFKSYRKVHDFMYQYNEFDKQHHRRMLTMLVTNICWFDLLKEKIEHKQK